MKSKMYYLLFFLFASVILVSCKDDDDDDNSFFLTSAQQTEYVNSWIYNYMSYFYYWNQHVPSRPDYSKDPQDFFKSILYKYNTLYGDRFSWLQENYVDLLNALSGYSPLEIGFEYIFIMYEDDPSVYVRVLYVKPGTEAEEIGIRRGMDIATVNGVGMTLDNYQTVFRTGLEEYKLGMVALNGIEQVTIKSAKDYADNPILLDTIYDFNSKNTGYLVYNFFASDKGDGSYSYDRQLAEIFEKFKQKDVANLVLDLRYNSGGSIESAVYLASALVSDRKSDKLFAKYEYNSNVMKQLSDEDIRDYFADKINERYSIPNLGDQLEKIYIITGDWTASASEMIINGLNPYISEKIVQIGETTYGKNVASATFIETEEKYKKYNKYGMQPIIAKVANANSFSEYPGGFAPDYEMEELDLPMYELGNINEPLLATALAKIADEEDRSFQLRTLPVIPKILSKRKQDKDYNMYINPDKLEKLMIKE